MDKKELLERANNEINFAVFAGMWSSREIIEMISEDIMKVVFKDRSGKMLNSINAMIAAKLRDAQAFTDGHLAPNMNNNPNKFIRSTLVTNRMSLYNHVEGRLVTWRKALSDEHDEDYIIDIAIADLVADAAVGPIAYMDYVATVAKCRRKYDACRNSIAGVSTESD